MVADRLAEEESILFVGNEDPLTEGFLTSIVDAANGVNVVVWAITGALQERVREEVPKARVFVSGLERLQGAGSDGGTAVGRLLLVDRRRSS